MSSSENRGDDFLPPTKSGEEARAILVNLLAGAIEVGTGLSGVGSFMSAGYGMLGLVRSNMSDAGKGFAAAFAAHREEFRKLDERVRAGEIDRELLNRRLTMTQRAIHEAGRHPDRALREALGAFAARVQITEEDDLALFEVADVLSRMTALDYDYLELLYDHQVSGKRVYLLYDGNNTLKEHVEEPGAGSVGSEEAQLLLAARYPKLVVDRVHDVEHRLVGFGLIADRNALRRERNERELARELEGLDPFSGRRLRVEITPVSYAVTLLGGALINLARLSPGPGGPPAGRTHEREQERVPST